MQVRTSILLDKELLKRAKQRALDTNTSLSQLVRNGLIDQLHKSSRAKPTSEIIGEAKKLDMPFEV